MLHSCSSVELQSDSSVGESVVAGVIQRVGNDRLVNEHEERQVGQKVQQI